MLQIITDPGLNPPFGSSWSIFGPLDVLFWSLGTTYNQQSTKANYEKTRKNPTQIQLQRLESTKINYEKAEQIQSKANFWNHQRPIMKK